MKNRDPEAIARMKQEVEENAAKVRSELGDTVPSDFSSEEEETLPKNTRGKRVKAQTPAPAIEVDNSSDAEEEETNKKRNVKAVSQPRRNQGKRRGRVSAVEGQSLPSDIEDPRAGAEIDDLIRAKAQVELENARLHQQLLQMQEEAERPKNPPQISRQIAPVTNQAENSK
jgi:hypothetical protein